MHRRSSPLFRAAGTRRPIARVTRRLGAIAVLMMLVTAASPGPHLDFDAVRVVAGSTAGSGFGAQSIVTGDFTGDGLADLAVADLVAGGPGTRKALFKVDNTDPQVIAIEESLKETGAVGEGPGLSDLVLGSSKKVNIPVFSVIGQKDQLFCGSAATDCTSSEALAASERRFYGPGAAVDALLVPNSGHLNKLELQGDQVNERIQHWIDRAVGS